MHSKKQTYLILLLALFITSCQKDEVTDPQTKMAPGSIEILAGNSQSGAPEEVLAQQIEVLVKDTEGNPYANATVNFIVAQGLLSVTKATTNKQGIARTIWTLGTKEGEQILTVNAFDSNGTKQLQGSPLTFLAHAETLFTKESMIGLYLSYGKIGYQHTYPKQPGNSTYVERELELGFSFDGEKIWTANTNSKLMMTWSNDSSFVIPNQEYGADTCFVKSISGEGYFTPEKLVMTTLIISQANVCEDDEYDFVREYNQINCSIIPGAQPY